MKHFIVHDAQGTILRTGSCPAHMLQDQAQPGETVIEGVADDTVHCIVKGKIQHKALLPRAPAPEPVPVPPVQAQLDAIWSILEAFAPPEELRNNPIYQALNKRRG